MFFLSLIIRISRKLIFLQDFFHGKLNFLIVAIEDTLDCVDFVKRDCRYSVVYISVIKRKFKGKSGYTFLFKVIHDNISCYRGEW